MRNLFLIAVLSLPLQLFSQLSVNGKIVDKSDNTGINGAMVMILHNANSFLYKYTRTDRNGDFRIGDLATGKYLLVISSPGYADYEDTILVSGKGGNRGDVGTIKIQLKAALLEAVIVKAKKGYAIKITGDTTEFTADSFKVQPHARVEDLLRQLPGIRVDSKGKITADGMPVKKVLVDGEEFFNDDPLLVTRNLRADMIDKVQLYDRSSDKAMFTGIADEQKAKTINLEIKKDRKNLVFGKIQAGGGNDGFYNLEGRANRFSDNYKLSVFALGANDGTVGVNGEDNRDGGILFNEKGLPAALSGGIHFDNKWNEGRNKTNGNYQFFRLSTKGNDDGIIQNNLPDRVITTTSKESFFTRNNSNRANGKYDFNKNGISMLGLSFKATVSENENSRDLYQERVQEDGRLLNRGARTYANKERVNALDAQLLWRTQLKKPRRTFSATLSQNYNQYTSDGALSAITTFFDNGDTTRQLLDQLKKNSTNEYNIDLHLSYTEPVGKNAVLLFNYAIGSNSNKLIRESYNNATGAGYDKLDSFYSSHYNYDQLSQRWGCFYELTKDKITFNAGSSAGYIKYDQLNLLQKNSIDRRFSVFNPRLKFNYRFTSYHWVKFNYNGNNIQPENEQLQPVANNDNPLSIYVGNTELKPAFNNTINLDYMNFRAANRRTILMNSRYSFVLNPIVANTITGSNGVDTFYYANMGSERFISYDAFLSYSRFLKALNINVSGQVAVSGSRFVNYANLQRNVTNAAAWSFDMGVSRSKGGWCDLSLHNTISYHPLSSSVQSGYSNNYWANRLTFNINLSFIKKYQFNAHTDYNFRSSSTSFSSLNYFILNFWLGRKFGKNESIMLRVIVKDLLNQNVGFNRLASNNLIKQNTYTTIRRYGMVSLSWDFNKLIKND